MLNAEMSEGDRIFPASAFCLMESTMTDGGREEKMSFILRRGGDPWGMDGEDLRKILLLASLYLSFSKLAFLNQVFDMCLSARFVMVY